MKLLRLTGLLAIVCLMGQGLAAHVYVMTSGAEGVDDAAVACLTQAGHTSVVGEPYHVFNEFIDLSSYDAVYAQMNANWNWGDMPLGGQASLVNFVANGGALVTGEWTVWKMSVGQLAELSKLVPVVPNNSYSGQATETFERVTPDTVINQGLPNIFDLTLSYFAGTVTFFAELRPGATNYYNITGTGLPSIGLAGWRFGAGRVMSFATCNGEEQLQGNGAILFGNVFNWAVLGTRLLPTFVTTIEGEEFAGDATSLADYDGVAYGAFNDSLSLGCKVIVRTFINAVPSKLHFGWAARAGRPGLALQVSMRDYVSGTYRSVSGGVASTDYEVGGGDSPLAASRFRNATGDIESRFDWSPVNDEDPAQDGWIQEIDLATWTYE